MKKQVIFGYRHSREEVRLWLVVNDSLLLYMHYMYALYVC